MDRKAWIILFLCSALLGANIYYSSKAKQDRQVAEAAQKAAEEAQQGSTSSEKAPGVLQTQDPIVVDTAELHDFETGKMLYHFSSQNGGIKTAEFKEEFAVGSDVNKVKLNRFGHSPIGALTSGPDQFIESNMSIENVVKDKEITYLGKTNNGLVVRKRYVLPDPLAKEPGEEYRIRLELTLQNASGNPVNLGDLGVFTGSATPLYAREWDQQTGFFFCDNRDLDFEHSGYFKGGFFSRGRETWGDGTEKMAYAGVMNQFFATVIKPSEKINASIWARSKDVEVTTHDKVATKYAIRGAMGLPKEVLPAGGTKAMVFDIYTLPKENTMLREMGQDMGEIMHYGWFSPISRVLNRVLTFLHDSIFMKMSNTTAWGLAIIALTVLLRFIMWPLHSKSQREMKRMSLLAPKMKALREKYPDDPQRAQVETMKLYREYGVSPAGGCLPMFVQIPIFFGFYRMLQYAVELRGEKFLWVDDLSQPDTIATLAGIPINLLPILMAGTMFLQMALGPKTGDKMQQRIFMIMPFIFFIFCYNFASALALYWTVGNIFQIFQTLIMKRAPEPELVKRDLSGKQSFMERMQEMQAQQQASRGGTGGPVIDLKPKKKKKRTPKTGG